MQKKGYVAHTLRLPTTGSTLRWIGEAATGDKDNDAAPRAVVQRLRALKATACGKRQCDGQALATPEQKGDGMSLFFCSIQCKDAVFAAPKLMSESCAEKVRRQRRRSAGAGSAGADRPVRRPAAAAAAAAEGSAGGGTTLRRPVAAAALEGGPSMKKRRL